MNLEHLQNKIKQLETLRLETLKEYLYERPDCIQLNSKLNKLEKELSTYVYLQKLSYYEEHKTVIEQTENIDELFKYADTISLRNKKIQDKITHQKMRFKKRFKEMQNPYFITITFTDEALATDFRRRLREFFKRNNISFCLVSDYGTKGTKRFHYHGIADIPYDKNGKAYNQELLKKAKTKDRRKKVYNFIWLDEHIGFNTAKPINRRNNRERDKAMKYCFKYIYKNPDREVFASRTYKKKL